jgi:hypothetical protein
MATFRLFSDVQMASDDRGTVLLDMRDGRLYSVNDVGRVILAALNQGKELSAVVTDVENIYRQPRSRLEVDVRTFIRELTKRGLGHAVAE